MLRPSALTIPAVAVCSKPSGLPIAIAISPRLSALDLPSTSGCSEVRAPAPTRSQREIGVRDRRRPTLHPTPSRHRDDGIAQLGLGGSGRPTGADHVRVRQQVAVGREDEARAVAERSIRSADAHRGDARAGAFDDAADVCEYASRRNESVAPMTDSIYDLVRAAQAAGAPTSPNEQVGRRDQATPSSAPARRARRWRRLRRRRELGRASRRLEPWIAVFAAEDLDQEVDERAGPAGTCFLVGIPAYSVVLSRCHFGNTRSSAFSSSASAATNDGSPVIPSRRVRPHRAYRCGQCSGPEGAARS
jgi:hypothetical protein